MKYMRCEYNVHHYSISNLLFSKFLFIHFAKQGWVMLNTNSSEKYFVISGLRPDTPYIFFVRSQNSDGFSGPSPLTPPIKTKGAFRFSVIV